MVQVLRKFSTGLLFNNTVVKNNKNLITKRWLPTTAAKEKKPLVIKDQFFETDSWTNVTPKILSHIDLNKHVQKHHPLSLLRHRIVNYFYGVYKTNRGNPLFSVYDNLNPIVTVEQNFDNLLIPPDHISRSKSDCYYINENYMLRGHTTAHQVDLITAGLDNFLVVGDVYRRDEINATHYPVFHQLDAVRLVKSDILFDNNPDLRIFENTAPQQSNGAISSKCIDQTKQPCHTVEAVKLMEYDMKQVLVGLAQNLFGKQVQYRWVETYFPFTQPSWELEIYHKDNWLEVLGCGIMRHEIIKKCGVDHSIGYAFGMGLERLAMILYNIPDIRLFWSNDTGFLSQFNEEDINEKIKYKPVSSFPQCKNDLSFWLPDGVELNSGFFANDFYDLVRSVAGDIVEQITLVDEFKNPKTGKMSVCFRIIYRHMERTLTQEEVNKVHKTIADTCTQVFKATIR